MSYETFFQLHDAPFRLPPDPDYYFPCQRQREGLETLIYSINAGEGFVQITGEPGVGKTLLVRNLLDRLGDETLTALILHPRLSAEELFRVILIDLGVDVAGMEEMGKEPLLRAFRDVLLAKGEQGIRTVVIIDEAQELPPDSLEELRLLSNLETSKSKLLQIVLVGQPELEERLRQPGLTQLYQRITIRYRLTPLSLAETGEYIRHRLSIAGRSDAGCFPWQTVEKIFRLSRGIPRRINILCERSLMAAYVDSSPVVRSRHVERAWHSIEPDAPPAARKGRGWPLVAALAVLPLLATVGWYVSHRVSLVPPAAESGREKQPPLAAAGQPTSATGAASRPTPVPVQEDRSVRPPAAASRLPALISLPPRWTCITLDRDSGAGLVWQGKGHGPEHRFILTGELPALGVYILARDQEETPFLFHQDAFFSWEGQKALAATLWQQVGEGAGPPRAVPVLVTAARPAGEVADAKRRIQAIRSMLLAWADSWRELDIDRHIRFYDSSLVTYRAFRDMPTIIGRDAFYRKKQQLFARTSALTLQISDPLCIIEPNDPDAAVILFRQRYTSPSYVDEGVKVLYLRHRRGPDAGPSSWRIQGRLWLPIDRRGAKGGREGQEGHDG